MVNVSNMSNDDIMQLKHNRLCTWQATCEHWVTSNISQMCPSCTGRTAVYVHAYVHMYIRIYTIICKHVQKLGQQSA